MKIISGGQIGADIAGLQIAKQLGFETGGWMPRGFKTKEGNHPEYAELYGCVETHDGGYPERTRLNVQAADVTLRFAHDFQTYGERCTAKFIRELKKPHLDVYIDSVDYLASPRIQYVANWLYVYKPEIINIAGNAITEIEPLVMSFLQQTFNHYLAL